MKFRTVAPFWKDYRKLPARYRKRADEAFKLFKENPRHPSFETHEVKGTKHPIRYEGYLDDGYRFIFHYEKDTIVFSRIGKHEIIDQVSKRKKKK